jgi:hypothetical protein
MLGLGSDQAASVVDDHDVQLGPRSWAMVVGAVGGDGLPRRRPSQEAQEHPEICRARHELFEAHAGDVELRQGRSQIGVTLVGADDEASRFGDGEVDAGDAGLRRQELRSQVLAGEAREAHGVPERRRSEGSSERLRHVAGAKVDGGQDDMARRLRPELDDELAQVGVGHLDAVRLQPWIEAALLGEHALALDHPRDATGRQEIEDDPVVLGGVARKMHDRAVLRRVRLELDQVLRQPAHGVFLDASSQCSQRLPLGQIACAAIAATANFPQRLIVKARALDVGQELAGARRV